MAEILGADLKPGMVFKTHGRIYSVNDIMDPNEHGARWGWFETTDGAIHQFYLHEDDKLELKDTQPVKRNRLVKVSAEDINTVLAVLGTLSEEYSVGRQSLQGAVERLKEAVR